MTKHTRVSVALAATLALVAAFGTTVQADPGQQPLTADQQMKATALSGDTWQAVHNDHRFAGMWIDDGGRVHVSYQGDPKASATSASARALSSAIVIHGNAKYTYDELVARRDGVIGKIAGLRSQGIHIVEWGPDEITNTLRLAVVDPSPSTVSILTAAFGADVEIQAVAEPEQDSAFSRWDDYSPWTAGGEINDGSGSCTSGPGILRNGTRYLLMAAHCFANGAYVYNGSEYVGKKNWIDIRDGGTDTAILTGTGSGTMFTSDTAITTMSSTPWTSTVGSYVCFNGAYSGEQCGSLKVIATNYCTDITGRLTCGTATAGKDGAAPAGHGDSGGPVHIVSPRWAYAGTIVGAASPQFVCPRNSQGGTRYCSSWVRFQMIGPALSYWNAALL